jgi:hypothetical protein
MILDKNVCKKIEYYLYNYESEHEQLELEEDDIIFGVKSGIVEGGRSNLVNSKTENSALMLIEKRKDNEWLGVIESVLDKFKGTEYEQIIEFTYKEQFRVAKILRKLALEKTAYYEKRNDIIVYAALKATERGLVKH